MDKAAVLWKMRDAMYAGKVLGCEDCGEEEDFSPNVEAWELSGKLVCDCCAEAVFDDASQAGADG